MQNVVKVLFFALVNAIGFFAISILANVAVKIGVYPELLTRADALEFESWLFGGGMWVWIAAAIASVGFFFTRSPLRIVLVLAPLYMTSLYGLATILYFNFIA